MYSLSNIENIFIESSEHGTGAGYCWSYHYKSPSKECWQSSKPPRGKPMYVHICLTNNEFGSPLDVVYRYVKKNLPGGPTNVLPLSYFGCCCYFGCYYFGCRKHIKPFRLLLRTCILVFVYLYYFTVLADDWSFLLNGSSPSNKWVQTCYHFGCVKYRSRWI